ncbi:ricin B-like lectin R40C1 [Panicum hallii]|uniref:ricin B-like lectin R40C1 n=1 Tax=Panicum hallii TaxID=206008 RepID=UPI000DF4EAC5|nr:ricin B-like lectin R40C1 [Panicum hallii]
MNHGPYASFTIGQASTPICEFSPQIPREKMFGFTTTVRGGGVQPTFKIFCKADENFCLTVRDGDAVLAPADFNDEHQHWYKDKRFGTFVKDEEGKHAFSLINKATNLAVQHFGGPFHPFSEDGVWNDFFGYLQVKLVRFDLDSFDSTLMWTLSNNLGKDGFGFIRTLNDISLKLAAFHGDHGVTVKLSDSCTGDNHHWKILPWRDEAYMVGEHSMRLYCKADERFSVTVRNGTVCLAPTNPDDERQHWVEDTRYGDTIKDEDGYPAFALINRATGEAIKKTSEESPSTNKVQTQTLAGYEVLVLPPVR